MSKKPQKFDSDPKTTGHQWDGIEEFDNPMPRWWLYTFYLCIIWGIGYTIAYPAWPMINSATAGVLGWSTRADVASEIAAVEEANAPTNAKLVETDLTEISADPDLNAYAVSAGSAVFKTWCAQCHGSGAAGAKGYPNLLDDDWLWGGSVEDIHATVAHGIRNEDSDDARYSAMPAFGRDELLEAEEIDQVVNYVMSLSGEAQDASKVEAGAVVFEDNCSSCHMEDGTGDRAQGAPNLADAIWLYGGDYDTLTETVTNARYGVMPAWNLRLSEAEIRAVTAYVHQLGGGE
ncbi:MULTISPECIES: cytochrome-c oxidase, cbb3-type subunit III [Rhodobacterales]|jgi:cytochrome c oxidase cbb3-type subunit 3|uniref:Cbb3-type cytochrome c oxidase subunit n=1 Tax=Phaeobacter gallaeciensis TaxID=60890 RepID=A0A1B0ZQ84_9RHOB|nr:MULTISPECIES: cytochrome-c oxidase, cbb3-type subunit III [Phaeobacter]MDF1772223.1 cytochrome-c oxidase, cbb3-type subunit III [Pseudophaeobacter sp. bin_em_oilr2.035]ANP36281.1 cytochrome Cbb3 [Phaeobacter gallaeciensis]MDE4060753.1 cytochrome-c oxidase, cbb3-type subunit III [Phaeobacter gallaeciensis]MDE4097403.1 cytochrome-c oxidase, cbb3-type subunit III [Phaeobacter gallaeciensis]MDE4106083.1 cytochrome-c oxidase, cbb3-type subunit III [Phaeobacter gallaeciensis]